MVCKKEGDWHNCDNHDQQDGSMMIMLGIIMIMILILDEHDYLVYHVDHDDNNYFDCDFDEVGMALPLVVEMDGLQNRR